MAIPLLPLWTFVARFRVNFTFTFPPNDAVVEFLFSLLFCFFCLLSFLLLLLSFFSPFSFCLFTFVLFLCPCSFLVCLSLYFFPLCYVPDSFLHYIRVLISMRMKIFLLLIPETQVQTSALRPTVLLEVFVVFLRHSMHMQDRCLN